MGLSPHNVDSRTPQGCRLLKAPLGTLGWGIHSGIPDDCIKACSVGVEFTSTRAK
jgi:hypothetical protein